MFRLHALLLSTTCLVGSQFLPAQDARPELDIVETAARAGTFETLIAAVQAAGLVDALQGEGPLTVLAPTDEAFAKLPAGALDKLLLPESRDDLVAILKFHVIAGEVSSSDALTARSAATLNGQKLAFELRDGRLRVDGANVVANDLRASNGVIHVIDSVLMPEFPDRGEDLELGVVELIELAVKRGAPLYNDGQRDACAVIYEIAARSMVGRDDLSADERQTLADAIRTARGESATEAAWALRRAFDQIWNARIAAERDRITELSSESGRCAVNTDLQFELTDFSDRGEARNWRAVNDTVMGGRSDSSLDVADGVATFAGRVSLENNGGFASVRRALEGGELSGMDGIAMRVRGDGRTYRLTVSKARGISPDVYDIEFATRPGEWLDLRLPFAEMRRNIMGRRPLSKPPAPESLRNIGLLIGDKKQGAFRLEIDHIGGYTETGIAAH